MGIGIMNICIKFSFKKMLEGTFAYVLLNYFSEASVPYPYTSHMSFFVFALLLAILGHAREKD